MRTTTIADFYLISTELRSPYEPRACYIKKRVKNSLRDDFALVTIDPPIHREIYNTNIDLSEIVLASRLDNASLFPVTEWPVYVYICLLKKDLADDLVFIEKDDFSIIDWGVVYPSEQEAANSMIKKIPNNKMHQ
jgi:hypothetical protein